jgi:iron(III) transport system ATP-binding protein
MNIDKPGLHLDGVSKIYANSSGARGGLQETGFSLRSGEFFTLLGPSGCGKTTTLRCIAGLEIPDCGLIRVGAQTFFDHKAGVHLPMNERQIGMVFQSYAIWPHMSVFENVAFPLRARKKGKLSEAALKKKVSEALSTVSLAHVAERSATSLSGGQQQRVAFARAVVNDPKLLLLDEPLSNLDASLRDEMRKELRRLQGQLGITTVYVTHDQEEALEMSDTIAVMHEGRVAQIGTPREIYGQPASAFVFDFIGQSNWLNGSIGDNDAKTPCTIILETGEQLIGPQTGLTRGNVAIGIRPEDIVLSRSAQRSHAPENCLRATIGRASFTGASMRYQVQFTGGALHAHGPVSQEAFNVGDAVTVHLPAQALRLFKRSGV